MNSQWYAVELTEICDPKQWPTIPKKDLQSEGFPVFGANGLIGYHTEFNHSSETILVGCRGSCGTVHICPANSYATGNTMALDDLDTDKVDLKFLYYLLIYRGFSDVISGSSQPQITRQGLETIILQIPTLNEQRRIAAMLDKADAIRRKQELALALADDFVRATFLDMFGDPVSNPKGWDLMPIGEFGDFERGKSRHRPRNDPALLGGIYPLIQTGDVANADFVIERYSQTYSELGLSQSRMWPKGTLCITIAANIADTATLGFDSCFPDSVVGYTPKVKIYQTYIQVLFSFLKVIIEEKAPQSAQKNINLEILRALTIPKPPTQLMEHFQGVVQKVIEAKTGLKKSRDESDVLFTSLSQRAFKGQL